MGLEVYHHPTPCQQIVVLAQLYEHGTALWPYGAVGGTSIPGQSEVVATGHDDAIVVDDALTFFLIEKQPPSILPFYVENLAQQIIGLRNRFSLFGRGLIDGEG